MESDIIRTNTIRIADATERAATALERIAAALERFWPVYVHAPYTPVPLPNTVPYTPPYINPNFPFSPTTLPYVPNNGNTMVLSPSTPIQSSLTGGTCDAGAGPSEPYPTRCVDPACGELHYANAPTRPAPVDLRGDSDLANYRARGCSGDPA